MVFRPLEEAYGGGDFGKIDFKLVGENKFYPYCKDHGAMNKVSRFQDGGGYWRCVTSPSSQCRAGCEEFKED